MRNTSRWDLASIFDYIVADKLMSKFLCCRNNLLNISFEVDGKQYNALVPDKELLFVVKDVLLNREYEYFPEFELKRFRGKRIVDAGAHVGLYSLVASTFAKEVVSVEPHPLNFKLLQLNLYRNDVQNVIPINKALWSKHETLSLYEGEERTSSSQIFKTT